MKESDFCYDPSILQAEFSLTQVLDRPATGRARFEEAIRENLDVGCTDQEHQVGAARDQAAPFPHAGHHAGRRPLALRELQAQPHQAILQGRAGLRTETTINDTRGFAIGRRLHNLPALRAVGFAARRRLLDVQKLIHNCLRGEDALRQVTRPCGSAT